MSLDEKRVETRKLYFPIEDQFRGVGAARSVLRGIPGDNMTMIHITLAKGFYEEMHHHVHEQIVFIISGRVRVNVGGQPTVWLGPGEFVHFPSNVPHDAYAEEDSTGVDVFGAPARNELLDLSGG
jgi:quercetin dioxygenase-like cupin family protein